MFSNTFLIQFFKISREVITFIFDDFQLCHLLVQLASSKQCFYKVSFKLKSSVLETFERSEQDLEAERQVESCQSDNSMLYNEIQYSI